MENNIEKLQADMENMIFKVAKQKGLWTKDIAPITDGITDISAYLNSSPKIMWVLKEPYDEIVNGTPCEGGWSITKDCFTRDDSWKNKTWQPIIYTMYGYLNGLTYNDMDYIRNDHSMASVLQQIAYINVGKMPALTKSPKSHMMEVYETWKDIDNQQIDSYKPDVIIFGGSFWLFKPDWEHSIQFIGNEAGCLDIYKRGENQLILDAYHPLQTQVSREIYVDSIIKTLNNREQII